MTHALEAAIDSAEISRAYRFLTAHPKDLCASRKSTIRFPIDLLRVDHDWRAIGVSKDDTVDWFWVGSHQDYEELLAERDCLLAEPGLREELDAFFEGLRDPRSPTDEIPLISGLSCRPQVIQRHADGSLPSPPPRLT